MKTQKTATNWPVSMTVIMTMIALFITILFGTSGSGYGSGLGGWLTGIVLIFGNASFKTLRIGFFSCVTAIIVTSVIVGSFWISLGWFIGLAVAICMTPSKRLK